jgi:pyruvate-formate lyase-activating enzyme
VTTGRVFDVQRFSVHDGPGIRTTVFLKGCPLRCRWCQNPEGLDRAISLWHFENLCGHTGRCQEICPTKAITLTPTGVDINHAACTQCGDCVAACPRNALALDGRDITTAEVVEEVGRDAIFHDVSGGGVTFSGGEPLAQAAFVYETAAALKARSVPTTLESSFHAPWSSIEPLLSVIDQFIVDVKVADPDAHRVATRVSNELSSRPRAPCRALHGAGRISCSTACQAIRQTEPGCHRRASRDRSGHAGRLANSTPARSTGVGMPRVADVTTCTHRRRFARVPVCRRPRSTAPQLPRGASSIQAIEDLVATAVAGGTVYISTVRERFAALPLSDSFLLTASLDGFDDEGAVFTFRLPKFALLADDERAMATEYVLAGHNIISTRGPRPPSRRRR